MLITYHTKQKSLIINTLLIFILITFWLNTDGRTCPGICIESAGKCLEKGGKIIGHCTNEMNCCDVPSEKIGNCGAVSNGTVGMFQSPNYPNVSSTSLSCQFTLKIHNDTIGILVEFIDFESDGHGFVLPSACESDYLFIRGFDKWMPPPICGYYTGYSLMIERNKYTGMFSEISLIALMSSEKYKWKIKLTQLLKHQFEKIKEMKEKPLIKSTRREETPQYDSDAYGPVQALADDNSDFGDSDDSSKSFEPSPYIVNGEDTEIESIPWQVSMRESITSFKFNDTVVKHIMNNCSRTEGLHFCGGSIISENLILTASHCFHSRSKKPMRSIGQYRIFVGDDNLCDEDIESMSFKVETILFHLAYDETMLLNDIAIVKIQGKITYTDAIKPVSLAPQNRKYEGRMTMASGWGLTNLTDPYPKPPKKLQSGKNFIIQNTSFCEFYHKPMYTAAIKTLLNHPKYKFTFDSLLCTQSETGSIANFVGPGDSGGPLVLIGQDTSKATQVGIVSYGVPFSPKNSSTGSFIDYFQSVSFFRSWIDLAMFALQ